MTRRGRVYTPAATSEAEDIIAEAWHQANHPTLEGPVGVTVDYYSDGQWITVRTLDADQASKIRWDVDNGGKLTLDGLQKGGAFLNDKQVMDLWLTKH
jgi:Holliday junction resolvase RusA-like endonuclease